ncbi:hypothetical protein KFE25_011310 [Diacronema lutheri]|uniref:Uncharacterized protein n=1 Tax=Diacronema lutheri TaxID=2081491 RepID=A0A8J5X6Z0_DIALT|nr:hypothetical protein KFE25_011310 [Diacronema lutheri]
MALLFAVACVHAQTGGCGPSPQLRCGTNVNGTLGPSSPAYVVELRAGDAARAARLSTCGSSADTVLELFNVCPLEEGARYVLRDDDGCSASASPFASQLRLDGAALAGVRWVRVSAYVGGSAGAFTLRLDTNAAAALLVMTGVGAAILVAS